MATPINLSLNDRKETDMEKASQSITILVLTLFLTIIVANAQTPQDIAKTALASTVSLTMDNGSSGSGFFVSFEHIVTSYHVIKGASSGYASEVFREKNYPIVGIAAIDDDDDLVILKVSGAQTPIPIGDSDVVKELDKIYIVGYSNKEEGIVTTGEIRGRVTRQQWIQKEDFLVNIANPHVYSGGPVLNEKGEIIGIIKATVSDADNPNKNLKEVVPAKYIRTLVAEMDNAHSQRFLRPLNVAGVMGTNLIWGSDSYEFTLFNQRNETIYDPYCLIIFKDEKGEIICTDQFVFGGMMFAGGSIRVPRRPISKVTDHSYYPYNPEHKPSRRPGVLDVSQVGHSVKQLMQSYEITIIDFDIDTAFPSQNTPLEGIIGNGLDWFELSQYSEIYGIDVLGISPDQQPPGNPEFSLKNIGFSYSIRNTLNKDLKNVRITFVFLDKKGVPIHEWGISRSMDIGAMKTLKVKGEVSRSTKRLTERVEPRIFPYPFK